MLCPIRESEAKQTKIKVAPKGHMDVTRASWRVPWYTDFIPNYYVTNILLEDATPTSTHPRYQTHDRPKYRCHPSPTW